MKKIRSYIFDSFTSEVFFISPDEMKALNADLFVSDENTQVYVNALDSSSVVIAAGEVNKGWHSIELILNGAIGSGLVRKSLIMGIGGGVLCDMAAFAASIYMRGCRVHLCPTTLLSMVDASVGGKTGIDYGGYKNMVGAFYPAEKVMICPETLATLSEREYKSGLAEVIKTGMIGDETILDILENNKTAVGQRDPEVLKDLIARCVLVKAAIVEDDLKEQGKRALLNLGHTYGHALETITHFNVTHGEGVAWGIGRALKVGELLKLTDSDYSKRIFNLLSLYHYEIDKDVDLNAFITAVQKDKKKQKDGLRFIIPVNQGDNQILAITPEVVEASL